MKYSRQRDRYACGAFVLLNAFKWMGINTSNRNLKELKRMLGTKPAVGTAYSRFRQVAKAAGFTQLRKPTIEKLDAELIAGNALIVDTRRRNRVLGHYYLIVRRTDRYFVCVNLFRNQTVTRISKERLARVAFLEPSVFRVKPLEVGNLIYYAPQAA